MHGGLSLGVKMQGTCHFEKKIGAIIPCHYLKNAVTNLNGIL